MTWKLLAGPSLHDIAADAVDYARTRRGSDIGRFAIEPTYGVFQGELLREAAAVADPLELRTSADEQVWSGRVFDLFQTRDDELNQLRYGLDGEGIISRIAAINPGIEIALMSDISVDTAIAAVLDAIEIEAADRDIGSSPRRLTRWWMDPDIAPWDMLLILARTAGPRARLFENKAGQLVFRDEPLAATPAYTVRGRAVASGAQAIISRLMEVEEGVDRVVNSVSLPVTLEPAPQMLSRVAAFAASDSGTKLTVTATISEATMRAAGVQNSDTLIVFGAAVLDTGGSTETVSRPSGLTDFTLVNITDNPGSATTWPAGEPARPMSPSRSMSR